MKKTLAVLAVVLSLGMAAAFDAEAKRLGGGKSSGMQRQNVTAPANQPGGAPGSPAQAAPAAGAAAAAAAPAAAAAKRNWMGPLAGLAAGIGLMALASHFGFGEAMANMMLIGLAVMAVLLVVGIVMRKRAAAQGPSLAGAGGAGGLLRQQTQQGNAFRTGVDAPQRGGSLIGSGISGSAAAASGAVGSIPADFDTAAFERNAKDRFMDLQAANDARDLTRLRDYLTPEMFEVVREDIASRGDTPQATEVFGLEARVLDVAEDANEYVVSVRLTGSVREQHGAVPDSLDEIWHLSKPKAGFGGWVIAGIQQNDSPAQG